MDDFSIQDRRIDEALSELKIANKYLGGISTTMAGLNILFNREKEISILDVGAGGSDNLIFLRNKFTGIKIISIDLNKRACKFLKRSNVGNTICADVLNVPVRSKQVDIVHASLFLHHFNKDKIKKMLVDFLNISKKGIIINDLRRSIPALIGIKIIAALFSKSEMFKNDGPISVRRGFVKKDWRIMLKESGIKKFEIKRKWAFRWLIVIYNE